MPTPFSSFYRKQLPPGEVPLYDALAEAMLAFAPTARAVSTQGLDLARVFLALELDYPEFFYYDYSKTVYNTRGSAVRSEYTFTLTYRYPLQEIRNRLARIQAVADSLVAGSSHLDKFARVTYLHDALANHKYVPEDNAPYWYYSMEGPLLQGVGVCSGWSRAFKYIMNRAGLLCTVAHGQLLKPDGTWGEHAWNYVQLDGKGYYIDLTNAKIGERVSHRYLNLSDAELLMDHRMSGAYKFPACPESRCPLPVASDIPALIPLLKAGRKHGEPITEARLLKPCKDEQEVLRALTPRLFGGLSHGEYAAIAGTIYLPLVKVFAVIWK